MSEGSQNFWCLIPAAGVGKRMQSATAENTPKQYLKVGPQTILEHTLNRMHEISKLSGIVCVLGENDSWWPEVSQSLKFKPMTAIGGKERMNSVYNGLQALEGKAEEQDWILVHDVVRPCVSLQDMDNLLTELMDDDIGGLLAIPVKETLKKVNGDLQIECTVPRDEYWLAATPQMFRYGMLKKALKAALENNDIITDEANAMENAGFKVKVVKGSADNIKITHVEDLVMAEHILNRQKVI